LSWAIYQEVVLGSSKYYHQDGGIPNTGIRLVLLDHGSMLDERDPYILSGQLTHELHYLKVRIAQKRHWEIQNIISRVVEFNTQKLRESLYHGSRTNVSDPYIFYNLSWPAYP
jgi:hypothetical protein